MRRALALAAPVVALALASPAAAATWTKYVDGDNGLAWSFNADYTYKDRQTGRLVVMQAISKPAANLGPGEPGAADGVGNVVALDCAKKNLIMLGSYKPDVPLDIKATWRLDSPKKADGADNEALLAAVCPTAANAPLK
ncbi:MAG: hypothetical protein GC203_17505 [Phenylobacterium sp.]|uniref:hypothetical protein n=1 Tax=Phenylobacterium sp. TaxID=1871053 RepID=UPI0025D6E4F5|nr:hypothetical protein [Phenylobacterium sp.]MBI1199660.1 hypothetical protein [Phenylobacterium sp.]